MATPPDELHEYARGEHLTAEDVNAFVRAAKRRISPEAGEADQDVISIAPPQHRVSLDLDGIYDVRIANAITGGLSSPGGRIPPFGVAMLTESQPRFAGARSRGYYAAQWPSSSTPYVPVFIVNGPRGIGAYSSGRRNGFGSMLFSGGWVAYSSVDDDGNTVDPAFNKEPRGGDGTLYPEVSWGPKPGSYLLWRGYNGFRVMGNTRTTYHDPEDDSVIKIVYAYQVLKRPDAHLWLNIGGSITTTEAVLPISDNASVSPTQIQMNANIASDSTPTKVAVKVNETGLYQYIIDGQLRPGFVSEAASGFFNVEIKPYRWTSTGGAGTYVSAGPTRTIKLFGILADTFLNTTEWISIHGYINLTRNEALAFKARAAGPGPDGATLENAMLSLRKVDDYLRVTHTA